METFIQFLSDLFSLDFVNIWGDIFSRKNALINYIVQYHKFYTENPEAFRKLCSDFQHKMTYTSVFYGNNNKIPGSASPLQLFIEQYNREFREKEFLEVKLNRRNRHLYFSNKTELLQAKARYKFLNEKLPDDFKKIYAIFKDKF